MDKWKRLDSKDSGLPDLLIKGNFDGTGYTIQLTDLSRVWVERLTKKKVIHRAVLEECSIDPTEGDDQYQILQQKISSAILQEEGTVLRISQHGKDGLQLELSAPVPPRVPPFWWKVELSLSTNATIEREIVTPLIRQAQSLYRCIDLLVAELHNKDRVISKITDRLEQSGNDLTTVFPGVSNIKTNRKRPQREQLAKHVKGLSDFDEPSWRAQNQTSAIDEALPGDWSAILAELPSARAVDSETEPREWWKDVYSELKNGQSGAGHVAAPQADKESNRDGRKEEDVDTEMKDAEFQRQDTPPRRQKAAADSDPSRSEGQAQDPSVQEPTQSKAGSSQTISAANDATTDDDSDDLDAPSQRKSQRPENAAATLVDRTQEKIPETQLDDSAVSEDRPTKSKKLGAFGGKNASQEEQVVQPSPAKTRAKFGTIGGKPAGTVTPEPAPEPPKARSKLRTIGGKQQEEKAEDTSRQQTNSPPPQTKQPSKLGTFGGKKRQAPGEDAHAQEDKSKHEVSPAPSSAKGKTERSATPEENPAQKAERLRHELKQKLDQEKKAPAKKKRRF